MKYLSFLILLTSTANANASPQDVASFTSNGRASFLRVQGIAGGAAAEMYGALKVIEKKNSGGAGSEISFKAGKSYRCFKDESISPVTFYCDLSVKDPAKGSAW